MHECANSRLGSGVSGSRRQSVCAASASRSTSRIGSAVRDCFRQPLARRVSRAPAVHVARDALLENDDRPIVFRAFEVAAGVQDVRDRVLLAAHVRAAVALDGGDVGRQAVRRRQHTSAAAAPISMTAPRLAAYQPSSFIAQRRPTTPRSAALPVGAGDDVISAASTPAAATAAIAQT